jgi:hypothetical protein
MHVLITRPTMLRALSSFYRVEVRVLSGALQRVQVERFLLGRLTVGARWELGTWYPRELPEPAGI